MAERLCCRNHKREIVTEIGTLGPRLDETGRPASHAPIWHAQGATEGIQTARLYPKTRVIWSNKQERRKMVNGRQEARNARRSADNPCYCTQSLTGHTSLLSPYPPPFLHHGGWMTASTSLLSYFITYHSWFTFHNQPFYLGHKRTKNKLYPPYRWNLQFSSPDNLGSNTRGELELILSLSAKTMSYEVNVWCVREI